MISFEQAQLALKIAFDTMFRNNVLDKLKEPIPAEKIFGKELVEKMSKEEEIQETLIRR